MHAWGGWQNRSRQALGNALLRPEIFWGFFDNRYTEILRTLMGRF